MPQDYRLPGFNSNVEKWDVEGLHYETLAICRSLHLWAAAHGLLNFRWRSSTSH
jgi:hypothetical protein